jgi:hypothetical protein
MNFMLQRWVVKDLEGPNVLLSLMELTCLSAGNSKQNYEHQGYRNVAVAAFS